MTTNIPRHYLYLAVISVFLLIFVIVFSFKVLIPKGKEYRIQRIEFKQELNEYQRYQVFYDDTLSVLKELQSKNRHIIQAFDRPFNPERFEKQHKTFFSNLQISQIDKGENEEDFVTYEVNTTSKINSPANFYDFLDAINKSDWILSINFPIEFKRDGEMINSSFTMKVYSNNKETNSTAAASVDK